MGSTFCFPRVSVFQASVTMCLASTASASGDCLGPSLARLVPKLSLSRIRHFCAVRCLCLEMNALTTLLRDPLVTAKLLVHDYEVLVKHTPHTK